MKKGPNCYLIARVGFNLTQPSHDSSIANTLYKLLDSATVPVEEFSVKIANLSKINHEVLTDHKLINTKGLQHKTSL